MLNKTLSNTKESQARDNVSDLQVYGPPDTWKCLGKASSVAEGWMKSTKAMNVPFGVALQVTTQQGHHVAEALSFIPGVEVVVHPDNKEWYTLVPLNSLMSVTKVPPLQC